MVVGLLLLFALGASAPYFSRLMNANERPRILQAIAWVDAAELAIDGPSARGIAAGVDVARSPIDGRLYPNKPPGGTVPAIVAYAGARLLAAAGGPTPTLRGVTLSARVLGALLPTIILLAAAARRLRQRGSGRAGDAAVVLLALATPLTSYAKVLFGHSLAACLLYGGWLVLFRATTPGSTSRRAAFIGGLLCASAISVEYLAAFAGLPLAIALVRRWRAGADVVVLGSAVAGALVAVAALAGYHQVVFGHPLQTGYHHVLDPGFAQTHARGLLGLSLPSAQSLFEHLLSPWGGLAYWAPLWLVALGFGLARWRDLDLEERIATGTFAMFVLIVASLAQTGGWRVGPRYLVLALPFALPALARLLQASKARPTAAASLLGLALGSTVLNAAASSFPHLIPRGNPWADVLLPMVLEGRMTSAVIPGIAGLVLMLGLPIGLVLATWRGLQPPPRSLVLGPAIAAALLLAATALPSHPEAEADIAAIRSIWEPGSRAPRRVVLEPLPHD